MTNEEPEASGLIGGTAGPTLTLRDWFAGMALADLIPNEGLADFGPDAVARWAYRLADCMLVQRAADRKNRDESAGDQAEELRDA